MIHITIKYVVSDKGKKKDQFSASKIQQEILKHSKQNEITENTLVSFYTTLREETLIYS